MNRRRFLQLSSSVLVGNVFATPAGLYSQEPAAKSSILLVNGAAAAGLDFVLRNGAAGHKYQVETLPGGLGVIDFDGDGWPDLFCTNGAAAGDEKSAEYSNRLYRNNRDGTFSDVTAKAGLQGKGYGMGVAVGDYNNDGHEDLFVAGVHGNRLYRNNGDGTFADVTEEAGLAGPGSLGRPAWSVAACWIDYDNDGRLDLFISNYCDWAAGNRPHLRRHGRPGARLLPSGQVSRGADAALSQQRRWHVYRNHAQGRSARSAGQGYGSGDGRLCGRWARRHLCGQRQCPQSAAAQSRQKF